MPHVSGPITNSSFDRTSLAHCPNAQSMVEALAHAYRLVRLDLAYSDGRNVARELPGATTGAFWEGYGPSDQRETHYEAPNATLCALYVAARHPRFPTWTVALLKGIVGSQLLRKL